MKIAQVAEVFEWKSEIVQWKFEAVEWKSDTVARMDTVQNGSRGSPDGGMLSIILWLGYLGLLHFIHTKSTLLCTQKCERIF